MDYDRATYPDGNDYPPNEPDNRASEPFLTRQWERLLEYLVSEPVPTKKNGWLSRIKTRYQTANIKRNQSLTRRAREKFTRKIRREQKYTKGHPRPRFYGVGKFYRKVKRGLQLDKNGFDSSPTSMSSHNAEEVKEDEAQ
jgi:hypothetical protein